MREQYVKCAETLLDFIRRSPSCFHAVDNLKTMFEAAGSIQLNEADEWKIEPGKRYHVTRNDSSVIAFAVPEKTEKIKGFHMIASHSDSPCFKVKEAAESVAENRYVKLNTEGYGGMIYSSWLDRPLSVAGRVFVKDGSGVRSCLVNIDRDLLVIPNVAIHMNREINKGFAYNPQVDMLPLLGSCGEEKPSILEMAAQELLIDKEQILGHDLFLYPRDEGHIIGAEGDFIMSPRLDDLQCAFSSAYAFINSKSEEYVTVCAVFDNEEVGSGTRQGADSTFLEDTLARLMESLGKTRSQYLQAVAGSFLISADNAHAVHPNHPEKADPTNRPYLNGGIVIKYHGSQKYATDGYSAAKMKLLCEQANVPFQTFANRSDLVGGSTLGNISASHVSVSGVDIGLPQLSMHSAMETAGVKDTYYAVEVFEIFYNE